MTGMRSNIRLNWQYFWRRNRKAAVLLLVAAALLITAAAGEYGGFLPFLRGAGRAGGGVWRTGDRVGAGGFAGAARHPPYGQNIVIHETGNIAQGPTLSGTVRIC